VIEANPFFDFLLFTFTSTSLKIIRDFCNTT
jgi:hypothetical protein